MSGMAESEERVALDANIIIAGILQPRWPHEVLRCCVTGALPVLVPEQVIEEARRHLKMPQQVRALDYFLEASGAETVPMPPPEDVLENMDLVRDASDAPVALALLNARVTTFVTLDRDFAEPGATATRFSERVRVMLPAVFLRDVMGWGSAELESIRERRWDDLRSEWGRLALPDVPP